MIHFLECYSLLGMLFPPIRAIGVCVDVSKVFHVRHTDLHTVNMPKVDTEKDECYQSEVILYKYYLRKMLREYLEYNC